MLSEKKILKRIKELTGQIAAHNANYYDKDQPVINDFEYDILAKELLYLEENYPHLTQGDSILNKVGGSISTNFSKVKHKVPMLSLGNSYSVEELQEFDARVIKALAKEVENSSSVEYCCELKMDGLAISIHYDKGLLIKAITRGDGKIGEDVTENIKAIEDIPYKMSYQGKIEIRGEIFLKKHKLVDINKKRLEQGDAEFSNPRNAAAGTIRQLDSEVVKSRGLSFYPYYIVNPAEHGLSLHSQLFNFLEKQDFVVNSNYLAKADIKAAIAYCEKWEEKRDELEYEFDGVVIKAESLYYQDVLASNMKTPRWAIAYKFAEENVKTILNDIIFQVGRLGTITPVAVLEPVEVSGAIVERATLHNADYISQKGIAVRDEVVIKRAAEVIPAVVMVSHRAKDREEIAFPSNCPICGTCLEKEEDNVAIYCPNLSCKGRLKAQLTHVVSRDVLNISGIGEKLVEQLVDQDFISKWVQLFDLNKDTLISLDRMGEKSVNNILQEIEQSKSVGLSKIIHAMGIKFIGAKASELVASAAGSYESLLEMNLDELSAIDGIGDKTAQSLIDFLGNTQVIDGFNYLKDNGVSLVSVNSFKSDLLNAKKFVITGSLEKYNRSDLIELIKSHKGFVSGSVSKKTDYVILGENPGSKYQKAKDLGVSIISEVEFEELLAV